MMERMINLINPWWKNPQWNFPINKNLLTHESKNGKNIYFIPLSMLGLLI